MRPTADATAGAASNYVLTHSIELSINVNATYSFPVAEGAAKLLGHQFEKKKIFCTCQKFRFFPFSAILKIVKILRELGRMQRMFALLLIKVFFILVGNIENISLDNNINSKTYTNNLFGRNLRKAKFSNTSYHDLGI